MILQQLYRDSGAILKQTGKEEPPAMYDLRPVRWVIELSSDERIPVHFSPQVSDGKTGERGIARLVPNAVRSSGVRPLLLADKPSYVLGMRIADAKVDAGRDAERDTIRTAQEHQAFKEIVRRCAATTADEDVAVVARFLDSWDPANAATTVPADMTRDHLITFRVDGERLPVENLAVQTFWAMSGQVEAGENNTLAMQCLVSGVHGAVEKSMPVMIKGIPGGQSSGTAIVSANASAFESYGLERAQTSPICRDAGERFGKALNALLASPSHRTTVGNVVYVYWAAEGLVPLYAFEPDPDPQTIARLFDAVHRGVRWTVLPDDAPFHIFGLSASGGRAVVRSALDTTIGEVGKRQAAWFERLRLIGHDGEPGKPLGLFRLAVAAYREAKDIPPGVTGALAAAALAGVKLPESLLQALVLRCRLDAERRVTYPRAALIKYILTQDRPLEEALTMSNESTGLMPAAYHCGRLFAELEDVQREAIPGINATISDRFFGSASSSPASVFGLLLAGARDHLGKLRKSREGAYYGAEKRLEEILAEISDFPKTLKLRDQALFSLGYYHHRASKRADIAARTAAKKQAAQTTNPTPGA